MKKRKNLDLLYFISTLFYNFLIALLTIIIPKRTDFWIFGGWFGERFADNSKYFFLYVANEVPEIKPVWITRDNEIMENLRKAGYKSFLANSISGFYHSFRAKYHIIDQSIEKDINSFASPGSICVHLWHAIPFKKIGLLATTKKETKNIKSFLFEKIKKTFPTVFCWSYPYMIATSDFSGRLIKKAFDVEEKRMIISGFPRTDTFFTNKYEYFWKDMFLEEIIEEIKQWKKQKEMTFAYFPTFRDLNTDLFLGTQKNEEIVEFDDFLGEKNVKLITKFHYGSVIRDIGFNELKNIVILDYKIDLYPILKHIDCLITDYSSVYFDFLLLNKPIIFYPYDLEYYKNEDRGFILDYTKYTPGRKVYNLEELKKAIVDTKEGVDSYNEERERIKKIMYKFVDGNSCDRIVKFLCEIKNEKK
jgi:CDP-glycerol glycerophosphotransferase